MTKDQLRHFLTGKKAKKLLEESTWQDLTAALGGLTSDQKDEIARLVAIGSGQSVINKLQRVMSDNARAEAATIVTTAFSDDNLTLQELEDLL